MGLAPTKFDYNSLNTAFRSVLTTETKNMAVVDRKPEATFAGVLSELGCVAEETVMRENYLTPRTSGLLR